MPYLFRVLNGKQKKVTKLFAQEGVELTRIPVSEYLIGDDPRCKILRYKKTIESYINTMTEITREEAESLQSQAMEVTSVESDIVIGKIVMITDGPYKGENGFVRKVDDKEVTVDICVFGRMHPVRFLLHQVTASQVPEAWQ